MEIGVEALLVDWGRAEKDAHIARAVRGGLRRQSSSAGSRRRQSSSDNPSYTLLDLLQRFGHALGRLPQLLILRAELLVRFE